MIDHIPPVSCVLRPKTDGRLAGRLASGEIILTNVSEGEVVIDYDSHSPLQYLDLVVTDAAGAALPTRFYGDLFGGVGGECLRLRPGEAFVHNVSLVGNHTGRVPAGRYTTRAVFRYGNWVTDPTSLGFELPIDVPGPEPVTATRLPTGTIRLFQSRVFLLLLALIVTWLLGRPWQ
jgi:hypothetical protein